MKCISLCVILAGRVSAQPLPVKKGSNPRASKTAPKVAPKVDPAIEAAQQALEKEQYEKAMIEGRTIEAPEYKFAALFRQAKGNPEATKKVQEAYKAAIETQVAKYHEEVTRRNRQSECVIRYLKLHSTDEAAEDFCSKLYKNQ